MFATLEEKLIVGVLASVTLLVGILGYNHHERAQGAAVCVRQDESAALAQSKKETANAVSIITTLDAQVAALSAAASAPAPMRVCNVASHSVSPGAATRSAQPAALPHSSNDSGVQTGTQSGVDIGPIVQDITLGCVLGITDATDLWNLAVKESAP